MLEVWSEWIASGDMTRDERRILRFLEGHEAVEQVL